MTFEVNTESKTGKFVFPDFFWDEKPKTTRINNRRYLGNKYKLLPFIKKIVNSECPDIESVADIFAGTGAVASAFIDKIIITNDILYSNYISHYAWFVPEKYSEEKVSNLINFYNSLYIDSDNYVSDTFGDTYFSVEDCRKIGYIREDIESRFLNGFLNERERALLITSLLYAADKIANTVGHYDAYRKGAEFEKSLELALPVPFPKLNPENLSFNLDTNQWISSISADLVYIDPPYNSRQYCDAYHVLENIAHWQKPKVVGIARKMDRSLLKSDYSTNKATQAFEDLISKINAKYILLSYNNMADKGNGRSNAKITDEDIMRILSAKGEVKVFTQEYKPFSTGKSEIKNHEERLFLCICEPKNEKRKYIESPLNYMGGKYKLLDQILPHFPKEIDTFVDLFCGGCNVGINGQAKKTILNDVNLNLQLLYQTFQNLGKETVFNLVNSIIFEYGLSRSSEFGYSCYGGDSNQGLANYNREKYLKLREDFNKKNQDYLYYIMLYVLVVYSFNNQIRFNKKGDFNLPVGKRDFNRRMQEKLAKFIDELSKGKYYFSTKDFRHLDFSTLTSKSLVYCDPPYLISNATYNEQGGWTIKDEEDLLLLLDKLNHNGIKFALSNAFSSKGKVNELLIEWAKKYRVIHLDYSYANSNYQTKDKTDSTDEILVMNYSGD